MLVMTNLETRYYLIAVNEVTSVAELIADLSYLDELPPGNLTLDFTYAAANVTQAIAAQHIPGHFGFHPLNHIIEQLSFIGRLTEMPLLASCCHEISVTLPVSSSHLGRFFVHLGVSELLNQWGLKVDTRDIWEPKGARDDDSRCVIIPLTDIGTGYAGCACDNQTTQIRQRIKDDLSQIFGAGDDLVQMSEAIGDIVNGVASLVRGGLLAALYFPTTGYLELAMMNRTEGAVGAEPDDQLDALVSELETNSPNIEGVLDRVKRFYGTMQLFNGFASLLISPDGSFTTAVERIGLPSAGIPGPRVNVVLQLPPKSPILWEPFAYERVANMWSTILN